MTDAHCDNLLLIQAEFDGELDASEAARALHHRESCAICRGAYAEFAAARDLMRKEAPYHRMPEELHRALVKGLAATAPEKLAEPPRVKGAAWWREGASFVFGTALAASIALLLVTPAQQSLLDQVVAGHIRALQPGHLEDVISTDQHTVKPWFDGRLDFAPPVKDLAAQNFPLIGGRLDYLDGRAVAALVYRRDKHVIDLFVWPDRGSIAPAMAVRNGYNTVHWTANGMSLWAVSDLEADQLRQFAEDWRAQ